MTVLGLINVIALCRYWNKRNLTLLKHMQESL